MLLFSNFQSFPKNHPFYTFHLVFNFLAAGYVYLKLRPYYSSKPFHNKYPEFKRDDSLSLFRLFLGFLTIVWPRLIMGVILLALQAFFLNLGKPHNPATKKIKDIFYSIGMRLVLFSLGCIIPTFIRRDEKCKEVYQRYLGSDYEISYDKKYATLIGNHCSFIDAFLYAWRYQCAYIGKKTASKIPLVRTIGIYNRTIYLDRTNEEDRHKVAEEIAERQKGILDGSFLTSLCIYPEGTITNNQYIIKFKRGAFMTCLPVKPMVELIDHNPVFELCTGALPMHLHLIYACCFLYNKVTFLDLPVIEPTEYMFRNYNGIINGDNFGEEKWHIYMEVTRHIMSEISGLKLSNVNFPEKLDYMSEIKGKKVKNT